MSLDTFDPSLYLTHSLTRSPTRSLAGSLIRHECNVTPQAIPAAIEKAGLSLDDIDIFEINEAFASQVRENPILNHLLLFDFLLIYSKFFLLS